MASSSAAMLEAQIGEWRSYLERRQAIHSVDIAELEDHLREQIRVLSDAGLSADEAFLVAAKRLGELDALSREFAREHSERLWKQLFASAPQGKDAEATRKDTIVAFALATAAALLVKAPMLFGITLDNNEGFYARNVSFFVLPLLAAYFAWKRPRHRMLVWLPLAFIAAAAIINAYPFVPEGYTQVLAILHLPMALWLVVGIAYAGGRWNEVAGRMDFIRFSGEVFIYYVLIALGGVVLMGFTALIFNAAGMDIETVFEWVVPSGAAGGVIVAAWLVEAKQSVIENMAPVLARLFTPFFAAALIAFISILLLTGRGIDIERNALIAFDFLLVMVLGLLLYSISARDPNVPPGLYDVVQVILVASALLADSFALSAIAARIGEFGFTPNRLAALGENLLLLVNLAWSAVLYIRFLRRHGSFADIERWQTGYLPVFAVWAAIVVIVFPPLFGFV
jgi:hypothetical protein